MPDISVPVCPGFHVQVFGIFVIVAKIGGDGGGNIVHIQFQRSYFRFFQVGHALGDGIGLAAFT